MTQKHIPRPGQNSKNISIWSFKKCSQEVKCLSWGLRGLLHLPWASGVLLGTS